MKPGFFFKEAMRSVRNNPAITLAATITVMIAVFILGAFIPSYLYVQNAVDQQKERLDLRVFISNSATDQQVQGVNERIAAMQRSGLVKEYHFLTSEAALAEFKQRFRDPELFDLVDNDIIPATFVVQPTDPANNDQIAAELQDSPALDRTLQGGISFAKETSDRLLRIAKLIQYSGLVLIGVLLVAAILLIGNTIRLSLFARRREVEVMRLVGATNWFVRWPFIIEGVITGVVGAVAAVLLIWAAKALVVDEFVRNSTEGLTRDSTSTISFFALSAILILAGGLVGALGSGVTLRRFLRI